MNKSNSVSATKLKNCTAGCIHSKVMQLCISSFKLHKRSTSNQWICIKHTLYNDDNP